MTPQEDKLVQLINAKEALAEQVKAAGAELEAFMAVNFPMGHMVQDTEGTVYKIVKPTGTFIFFREIDYARTRRNGEKQGTLSLTEAKEAGFVLPEAKK